MKIVFMGTPEIAVPTLDALHADGHEIAAVFTQPDRPAGRGKKLRASAVKQRAEALGLPVYQPESLRRGDDAAEAVRVLQEIAPELIVVIAYGQILPKEILCLPQHGCINLHASLLPRWRGAAPIQRVILAGDTETGVTAMQMAEGLDTGDMLHTLKIPVAPDETAETLHDKLADLAADTIRETLALLQKGELTATPQDDSAACTAAKVTKDMSLIDFKKSAQEIDRTIRAVTGAALLCGRRIKIRGSVVTDERSDLTPGTVLNPQTLTFVCGDGRCVRPLVLQAEGSRAMPAAEFLRGFHVAVGDRFSAIV